MAAVPPNTESPAGGGELYARITVYIKPTIVDKLHTQSKFSESNTLNNQKKIYLFTMAIQVSVSTLLYIIILSYKIYYFF